MDGKMSQLVLPAHDCSVPELEREAAATLLFPPSLTVYLLNTGLPIYIPEHAFHSILPRIPTAHQYTQCLTVVDRASQHHRRVSMVTLKVDVYFLVRK